MHRALLCLISFFIISPWLFAHMAHSPTSMQQSMTKNMAKNIVVRGVVRDSLTREPIESASVSLKRVALPTMVRGMITHDAGEFILAPASEGAYLLTIRMVGYTEYSTTLTVQAGDSLDLDIALMPTATETEEVVISATRTARKIDDVPLRMEILPAEDLDESITVGIASAKMVLGELPGVMAQTNSAATGAATVRLRGLDGRYTQILQDGVPAFGGLNMNFSVLTLPPLNLRQLEIIKGSAAGLYSGDALGGVINYITKSPERATPELLAVASYGSLNNTDIGGFYGQKFDNVGLSLHATANFQPRRDLDGDGFADVADQRRFSINPKIVIDLAPNTRWTFTPAYTYEQRQGGEMSAPLMYDRLGNFRASASDSTFFSALQTSRLNAMSSLSHRISATSNIAVNASFARTERTSLQYSPAFTSPFSGTETIGYADAHYAFAVDDVQMLVGVAAQNHVFSASTRDSLTGTQQAFAYTMVSGFVQAEYAFSPMYSVLASFRADKHNQYGMQAIPRVSLMARATRDLTFRVSTGLGWRAATMFDETAEERNFRGVPALTLTTPERSWGITADAQYRTIVGTMTLSGNLALFRTSISNQTLLQPAIFSKFFDNRSMPFVWSNNNSLISQGAELITEIKTEDLSVFFGYTYADVTQTEGAITSTKELTPKHFINAAVLWEEEQTIRVVSDFMLQSPQDLPSNPYRTQSPTVITWGGSIEVWLSSIIPGLSVFFNVENALDFRQTRTMPLYLGSPRRQDYFGGMVWGPVDGRVMSIGVKYKW